MATLYTNFVVGALSAGISSSDTTVSASVFSALPVVTGGDQVWLVIDPQATAGAPEVVKVTAHTASATSVTVDRGQQGTTARAHLSGVAVTNPLTDTDATSFLTSALDLDDGSIPTAKIADSAVTTVKVADAAVTTVKLADASVTDVKLGPDVFTYSTGDVKQSIRTTAETGWLAMGTSVPNADTAHPALWALVPASWKSGTTLNLPSMSDRVVRGGGTLGATDGASTVTLAIANLPGHTHTTPAHTHPFDHGHANTFAVAAAGDHAHSVSGSTSAVGDHQHTQTSDPGTGWVFRPGAAVGFGVANGINHYFQDSGGVRTSSAAGGHGHSVSGTAATAGSHAHTLTGAVTNFAGSTSSSGAGTSGSTGSGSSFSIAPAAVRLNFFIKT